MRQWLDEGRVTGDSLLWREGWADWKRADAVFTRFGGTPVGAYLPQGAPVPVVPAGAYNPATAGPPVTAAGRRTVYRRKNGAGWVVAIVVLSLAAIILGAVLVWVLTNNGTLSF
jgi:hypothetical protein